MSTPADNGARPSGISPPWWCSTTRIHATIHTIETEPAADDRDPFVIASRRVVRPLGEFTMPAGSYLDRVEIKAGDLLLVSLPMGPDPATWVDDVDPTPATAGWLAELNAFELFLLGEVAYLTGAVLGRGLRRLLARRWPLSS